MGAPLYAAPSRGVEPADPDPVVWKAARPQLPNVGVRRSACAGGYGPLGRTAET